MNYSWNSHLKTSHNFPLHTYVIQSVSRMLTNLLQRKIAGVTNFISSSFYILGNHTSEGSQYRSKFEYSLAEVLVNPITSFILISRGAIERKRGDAPWYHHSLWIHQVVEFNHHKASSPFPIYWFLLLFSSIRAKNFDTGIWKRIKVLIW